VVASRCSVSSRSSSRSLSRCRRRGRRRGRRLRGWSSSRDATGRPACESSRVESSFRDSSVERGVVPPLLLLLLLLAGCALSRSVPSSARHGERRADGCLCGCAGAAGAWVCVCVSVVSWPQNNAAPVLFSLALAPGGAAGGVLPTATPEGRVTLGRVGRSMCVLTVRHRSTAAGERGGGGGRGGRRRRVVTTKGQCRKERRAQSKNDGMLSTTTRHVGRQAETAPPRTTPKGSKQEDGPTTMMPRLVRHAAPPTGWRFLCSLAHTSPSLSGDARGTWCGGAVSPYVCLPACLRWASVLQRKKGPVPALLTDKSSHRRLPLCTLCELNSVTLRMPDGVPRWRRQRTARV
jgi:hypothetical protein